MTPIAVVGMGRMGQAVAHRLLEEDHEVFVWNRSLGRTSEVVTAGAHAPANLAATVDAAEIVITILADDDAVRDVVLADGGLAALLDDRLYIDASTISPTLCVELADAISRFVAMPLAGAPSTVREGTAVCLAGGPAELISEAAGVLKALSSAQHIYPRAEQAAVAKIANNNLLLIGLAALAESVVLGRAGGLSDQQIRELFEDSAMVAPGVRNRLGAVLDGDGPTWWTIQLGRKDAQLALALGRDAAADVPLTLAASERYDEAVSRDLGEEDIAAIARVYGSTAKR